MKRNIPCLTDVETQALNDLKSALERLFPVKGLYLFGSKARGDFAPDSDVDVIVVIDAELTSAHKHRISDATLEINLSHGTQLSVISVTLDEWNSEIWSLLPLFQAVRREGIAV